MMSMTGFSSIPGSMGVRTAIQRFGARWSIIFGLLLSIAANVSNCTLSWLFLVPHDIWIDCVHCMLAELIGVVAPNDAASYYGPQTARLSL